MTVETYRLTGHYDSSPGVPGRGFVYVVPSQTVVDGDSNVVVGGVKLKVDLDVDGDMCNADGDKWFELPTGIGYTARPILYDGYPPEATWTVAPGTVTLDMADVTDDYIVPLDPTGLEMAQSYTDTAVATRLPVSVPEVHVDSFTGTDKVRLAAACAAATAVGGTVVLPDRPIDVGNGFSMSGYSCLIRGRHAGWALGGSLASAPLRSAIWASTQSGPVLDFTGFIFPRGFRAAMEFGNFTVAGSGIADPTKANVGIFLPDSAGAGTIVWRNLMIGGTGGPCFRGTAVYLQNFENVRLMRPIAARTNDVPHFHVGNLTQCNVAVDLYSPDAIDSAGGDCAPSGAFLVDDQADVDFASTMDHIDIRCENLHVPTDGAIISWMGNASEIELRQSDCKKETGATNTCFIRLMPSSVQNNGGNLVKGLIWGSNGSAVTVDVGVDIQQPYNRVDGTKGFKGNNVRLAAGVHHCYVKVAGGFSGSVDPAFIDNSGMTTNTLKDYYVYPGTGVPPVDPLVGSSQSVDKVTDTARTNNTVAADSELVLALAAGRYELEGFLRYDANATAKIKSTFDMATGAATGFWSFNGLGSAVTATTVGSINRADTALGANQVGGCAGSGTVVTANPSGRLTVTSAGNFVFKWAQNTTDAGATNLLAGSWLRATKIA